MKTRLQRIISVLCILALALGALSVGALADEDPLKIVCIKWDDGNNYEGTRPPSVTIGGTELSAATGWTGVVPSDANLEVSIANYGTPTVSGNVLTYRYTVAETGALAINVVWDDNHNQFGLRPSELPVRLMEDGKPYSENRLAGATNGWSVDFGTQPAHRKGSQDAASYTAYAPEVLGYERTVNGLTVTYRVLHNKLTVDVDVSNAPDGADISGLTVKIDGPDRNMPTTLTWAQLQNGPVELDVIPGTYLLEDVNADLLKDITDKGYMLQNSDRDFRITDAVQVKGVPMGQQVTNDAKLEARFVFVKPDAVNPDDLPDPTLREQYLSFEILGPDNSDPRFPMKLTYQDFTDGEYHIEQVKPGSYTVVERNANELIDLFYLRSDSTTAMHLAVAANGTATATLVNHYTPAPRPEDTEVSIPVMKTWNDNNNADGNRPAEITVRLYANGAQVATAVLNNGNNWMYTFENMPRYTGEGEERKEISYSITEDAVPMYRATIRDYSIINDYEPELVSASVSKIWNDDGNAAGQRPHSIAMSLSNGEEIVKVVVLSDQNGWTATVNNLPAIRNGQRVTYTWFEQESLGYYLAARAEDGNNAVFTNASWERPPVEEAKVPKKAPGNTFYIFEDYETPLGVEIMINHVGDCFD